MEQVELKSASLADIEDVLKIEESSFSAPFTREMFESLLEGGFSSPFKGFISKSAGITSGYIIYAVAADEVDLLTVAVDKRFRRKGIATLLINKMFDEVAKKENVSIYLEVRKSNISAQALYNKLGFLPVGERKKYYEDNKEDAILMQKIVYKS